MTITNKAQLISYNTFNINATAKQLVTVDSDKELTQSIKEKQFDNKELYILGGGSNILFTKDFEGTLIHSQIKTLEVVTNAEENIVIKCGSGINWDWLVNYCVTKGWGGIENLSDIPGNVGAAPVQNIGAYGVEAKDVIEKVEGINLLNGEPFSLNNDQCQFGYRNSIFKQLPNYFITHVFIQLSKHPEFKLNYGTVANEIKKLGEVNLANIRKTIMNIRQSKLPSTDELGSAGSFFKNPVIDKEKAEHLLKQYPEMPSYDAPNNQVKLSAAWLIDQSGLKGYKMKNVGTYPTQPLVIVNYGNANGQEVIALAKHIQEEVQRKFGISLWPEVIYK